MKKRHFSELPLSVIEEIKKAVRDQEAPRSICGRFYIEFATLQRIIALHNLIPKRVKT